MNLCRYLNPTKQVELVFNAKQPQVIQIPSPKPHHWKSFDPAVRLCLGLYVLTQSHLSKAGGNLLTEATDACIFKTLDEARSLTS